MLGKFVKGRAYVFIDAANILYSQKTLGWRLDYQKLKTYLRQECDLQGLYFYTGKIGQDHKQANFLRKMEGYGYKIRSKEVKIIKVAQNIQERKGDLDVELVIDALKNLNNFDTCILMSGDSDFASLVDELKAESKWVIVLSTKGHISRELIERAKYVNLKKLRNQLIFEEK